MCGLIHKSAYYSPTALPVPSVDCENYVEIIFNFLFVNYMKACYVCCVRKHTFVIVSAVVNCLPEATGYKNFFLTIFLRHTVMMLEES